MPKFEVNDSATMVKHLAPGQAMFVEDILAGFDLYPFVYETTSAAPFVFAHALVARDHVGYVAYRPIDPVRAPRADCRFQLREIPLKLYLGRPVYAREMVGGVNRLTVQLEGLPADRAPLNIVHLVAGDMLLSDGPLAGCVRYLYINDEGELGVPKNVHLAAPPASRDDPGLLFRYGTGIVLRVPQGGRIQLVRSDLDKASIIRIAGLHLGDWNLITKLTPEGDPDWSTRLPGCGYFFDEIIDRMAHLFGIRRGELRLRVSGPWATPPSRPDIDEIDL